MSIIRGSARVGLALALALAMSACGDSDSPLSPDVAASVSGVVVADQTGDPIAGVDVDLERCRGGAMMMTSNEWTYCERIRTDSQGRFHFEYMYDSMHRYRVTVRGATESHCMYYLTGRDAKDIVLRVP